MSSEGGKQRQPDLQLNTEAAQCIFVDVCPSYSKLQIGYFYEDELSI